MKNAHWYIIAVVAIAIAFLVKSPYMAFALYAFLLLVALANFSSLAWLAGLDCERSIDRTTLRQGEEAEVTVTVRNARGWPIPWIYFEDYGPADFPCSGERQRLAVLMPGRATTLKYRLQCPRRGYHRIGPLLMESGDLFGLQRRFRTGKQQDYISVLPTVAYIDTFNVAFKRPQGPIRISNRIYQDPTRINNIREYVPGDPLNTVHWKATARTGQLHVKTFEPSSVTGGTLLLDLFEDSYFGERREYRVELAVTTAASVAYLLQMSGEQVGMVTNARDAAETARHEIKHRESLSRADADGSVGEEDEDTRISPLSVMPARSPVQARKIIENLARVLPGRGLDAVGLTKAACPHLPHDTALLPVVPYVSERLALTLGAMKQTGFGVTVFVIDNERGFEEAQTLLAPHDIHVFHIAHERHLHEISPAKIG